MAGSDPLWSWPHPHATRIRKTTNKKTTQHKRTKTAWCLSQCSYDPESKPKSVHPLRIIHPQLFPMHYHVAWLQHDDLDHWGSCVLLEGGNPSSSSGASSSRRSTSRFPCHGAMARSTLRVARSLTSLPSNGQWLRRECFASVEPDRPRALMIEVVVVRSDEDDSHALPKRMTNEDVTRMQSRTAADSVSTYSLHAIHYSSMHQYTSA